MHGLIMTIYWCKTYKQISVNFFQHLLFCKDTSLQKVSTFVYAQTS